MLSSCCQAEILIVYGEPLCAACHGVIEPRAIRITAKPRDIMAWVFTPRDRTGKPLPPEAAEPPKRAEVFVRINRHIRKVDRIRGKPDAWFWIDV